MYLNSLFNNLNYIRYKLIKTCNFSLLCLILVLLLLLLLIILNKNVGRVDSFIGYFVKQLFDAKMQKFVCHIINILILIKL